MWPGLQVSERVVVLLHMLNGRLAQLGEHIPYKDGVTGSSPVPPTISPYSLKFISRHLPRHI